MTMQGLIARKIGMTRIIDEAGQMVPVTLLKVEGQRVTKVMTIEKEGYSAFQVGYHEKPERKLNKPDLTRLRKSEIKENYTNFKEFRLKSDDQAPSVGSDLTVDLLTDVSNVDVTGITKGHGFEGAITRWHHATGRATHGSHFHRRPGSLGQRSTPGRTYRGKHMPGHMGCAQRTIQNLTIMDLDSETNVVVLKGSVPGHRDSFVVIKPSVKNR